ncbi:transcriptional corepressor of histone genes (Hir3), putative [Talaromyces stipitatus ATCC 10500]|uniref:Histone transcription regulator 3 homolog n=1 Tax=Talaromyces stipitatus (strain ATCC 10500 / CBS 375.48 / QM 6759 / NRRL 1006) TaxID=441959 RepID=B8M5I9_TALSN|nr:transcriptional corepressor of histone genes (Hir3), putative [Talaromyces stipitatus ATCC 10500]EED19883.1 transcriptional corepressor of histone genes (Hir3), putative [Talaromyces stipitatus ATCC 10500]
MASFTALNIEPAEDIQEEVDDTKELQIEEALKLYQNALKLHSQGPAFYPQAKAAYSALLQSEIFKYPEAISDYQRSALTDGDNEDAAIDALGEIDVNDAAASALPRTIFLAYKNNGQFILDLVKDMLRRPLTADERRLHILDGSRSAMKIFASALERDDTDLDLWRKSARIGAALNSYRLARYCLESVLVGDDNEVEVRTEQLGLDEAFAAEDLRNLVQALKDELSSIQAPPLRKPRPSLFRFFGNTPRISTPSSTPNQPLKRHIMESPVRTWDGVGKAIMQLLTEIQRKPKVLESGAAVGIEIPFQEVSPQSPGDNTLPVSANPSVSEKTTTILEAPNMIDPVDDQSSIDQHAESQLRESLEGFSKQSAESQGTIAEEKLDDNVDSKSSNVNPRKRSSTSLANDETGENLRAKSRRIRARESNVESLQQTEDINLDNRYFEDRLEDFAHADRWMFGTLGELLLKAGVDVLGTVDDLKKQMLLANSPSSYQSQDIDSTLVHDLQSALRTWNEEKSRSAMQGDSSTALLDSRGRQRSGLAIFLDHSRKSTQKTSKKKPLFESSGLAEFTSNINECWLHIHEIAFQWLSSLLQPGRAQFSHAASDRHSTESSYVSLPWPEGLKETIVQLLIHEDAYIYERLSDFIAETEQQALHQAMTDTSLTCTSDLYAKVEMVQTIHELHLDIHAHMNNPNSEIDQDTRALQRDRLTRWGALAQTAVNNLLDTEPGNKQLDKISLRHLWSMTFYSNMAEDVSRDHILRCLQDLKEALVSFGNPEITLTNNAFMPEVSAAALDQEITRLNSMGFFMRIFGSDGEDPVSLIESIEPVLDPASVKFVHEDGASDKTTSSVPVHFQELASFLDKGDATLRLFLWRRLQDAYQAIEYTPKVVSCQLRSIEAIINELRGKVYLETQDDRASILLRWLKSINNILSKLLPQLIDDPAKSFECIDVDHLHSSMTAVAHLARLLHSFTLYEDAVKVGQRPPLELRGALGKSLDNFKEKLRDMQVRCWVLQYMLLKEYMTQEKEKFPTPSDDQIQYLRAVHNALGVRSACKYADKLLLRLMKSELLSLETQEDCEFDIAQVLLDLHGLKFSIQMGTSDHGCPIENPDSESASMMIDFVLMQVNRLNMKDLSRSDLKTTIEKVQQAIGPIKHPSLSFNKRIVSAYLKSPINPSELFELVRGVGGLVLRSLPISHSENAKKGWYFLLGHASLTKFRSQKRLNAVPTNDLDDAIGYFRQDLEYATERWETWYRLAQTYDSKLEEDIMWSADKINNNQAELASSQRCAIHCYAMAVAGALKAADDDSKTRQTISELFTDFGMRLYASSREPLNMAAFSLEDFERHYSRFDSQEVYTGKPFKELEIYSVWSLAAHMFRRAMVEKPTNWVNHYMLSKCRWKMFNSDEATRGRGKSVTIDDVLNPLLDAIEVLPQRKERSSLPDRILEPHFRLVSVLHKLVLRHQLEPSKAGEILAETSWSKNLSPPQNTEEWKPYVLDVLKKLKHADKSNWHHRILSRMAKVHYDGHGDVDAATAAKNELMPQIFTKTMVLQVWRPEYERPGRHFVYTTQYVAYFTKLLDRISDHVNLEQLLRRVRKKQGDYINHTKLWEDMCIVYAKLVRRAGNITEHYEEGVFKQVGWDEFVANTARLDDFKDLPTTNGPTMDLLREAVEFKKLNNNLIKVTMFEDLTADIYARLYEENKHRFIEQANEENRGRMRVDHLLMNTDGSADVPTPPTSAPASEAPVPRGRTKGISRRDIQKRAEAIVSRHTRPAVTKTAATPVDEEKFSTAPIVRVPTLNNIQELATENKSAQQDSMSASLHESADDESELSEVDEEYLAKLKAEQSLLFPNLKSMKSPEPVSELSTAVSVDGDGNEKDMTLDDENNEADGEDDMEGEDGDTEFQVGPDEDEEMGNVDEEPEDVDMDVDKVDTEFDGDTNIEEVGDETVITLKKGDETEQEESMVQPNGKETENLAEEEKGKEDEENKPATINGPGESEASKDL